MAERLQKIIARAGLASRRRAEELITQGRVTVNGMPVTTLGAKADPEKDSIKVDGKRIRPEAFEYYAVHKPQGLLSSVSDPLKRPLVTQLVPSPKRLYPVGRLDFQSEGLMILTNDGELAQKVLRSSRIERVYRVKVRGQPSKESLNLLRGGICLEGEKFAPSQITPIKRDRNCWYRVVLREGRNRQIRRMFDHIGHPVMRLKRVAIGPVKLESLAPGGYRKLTDREVTLLKQPLQSRREG